MTKQGDNCYGLALICLLISLCTSCQSNEISAILEDIKDKLHSLVFKYFTFSLNIVYFFTKWWEFILSTLFSGSIVNCLTRHVDDLSDDEPPSSTLVKHR